MKTQALNDRRWEKAAHAMQTAVRLKMTREGIPDDSEMIPSQGETSPKHLRVGVNIALCDHASLVVLLISKGVITEQEYYEAIADGMEEEVQSYRRELELPDQIDLA